MKLILERIGITCSFTLRLREKQKERGVARPLCEIAHMKETCEEAKNESENS